MIENTKISVSGERFYVVYSISGDSEMAYNIAKKICVEQTIEFPPELIGNDDIRGEVFGRIESFEPHDIKNICTISYAAECSSYALPQLLNVIYGNISLFPNIRVEKFELPPSIARVFKGPRFGRYGLRDFLKVDSGPVFMSALKPQGLSAEKFSAQAYELALGGLNIIKDDHGLANQPFAPFKDRIQKVCEAVRDANEKTGGTTVYAPMLSSPNEQIIEMAHYAKAQGVGAFLVSPALVGFDLARRLAEDDSIGLPIIGHPALMGSYVVSATNGFSHYAMFGQVMRLIGMDASIYPNHGGRFLFSSEECRQIIAGCGDEMNHFAPIFPSPGGGMTFENIPSIIEFYGDDVMYLIGGDLHKQSLTLSDACIELRKTVTWLRQTKDIAE